MKYEINVEYHWYEDNGWYRCGGTLPFNDADDFIMMWNYFRGDTVDDDGKWAITSEEIDKDEIRTYSITGAAYKLWKEWEAKEEEKRKAEVAEEEKYKNNEELPF